jgi:heme/copper-type cytochrome/quinol oxidase subunit 4
VQLPSGGEGCWSVIALILAIVIVLVVMVEPLWVVYELNSHMTPSTATGS